MSVDGGDKGAAGNECREGGRRKGKTLTGWYNREEEEEAAAEEGLAHAGGGGGGGGVVGGEVEVGVRAGWRLKGPGETAAGAWRTASWSGSESLSAPNYIGRAIRG